MSDAFYNILFYSCGIASGCLFVIGIQRITMPKLYPIMPGQKWLIPGRGIVQIKTAKSTFLGGYTAVVTDSFTCFGADWFNMNPKLLEEDPNVQQKKLPELNPNGTVIVKSF